MRAFTRAHPELLARVGLALLVVALFREPLLQGGVLYERDVHLIWHPQVEGFVRAVAGGSLPLWDPSPAFGQPLLADPGAQVLYPPTWLNLLLRPWTYYTLFVAGHVFVSALAFFALARRWRLSVLASLAGASAWALCGPLLSLLTLWHHFAGASLAPLVFAAAERALALRRAREVVLLGMVVGVQVLAGSADMCALTLLALAGWVAMVHVRWRRPQLLAAGGAGLAAALLAAALGAGQWIASLELVTRSSRRELPGALRAYWSMHPLSLLETVFSGVPAGMPLQPWLRQSLFEGREPFLGSLYLGLPALALAGAGLAGRGQRRQRLALGALLTAAVLVALGRHLPVYAAVTATVPWLRLLRYPVKAMVVAAFAWSGLVAFGVETLRSSPTRAARLAALLPVALATGAAAVFSAAVLAQAPFARAWAAVALTPDALPALMPIARTLALHALAGLVAAVLAWRWARGGGGRLAAAAALLVTLDLAGAHRRPSSVAPAALYSHRPEVLAVLEPLERRRVYSYDYTELYRAKQWGDRSPYVLARQPSGWTPGAANALALQMSLAPQTPGRWGLRQGFDLDFRGLQAEPVALFTRLVRVVEDDPDAVLRLLRLASVTHVVALHRLAASRLPLAASVPGLFRDPVLVLEVPDPLPRIRLVGGVRVASSGAELAALLDPEFDAARTVLLPEGRPTAAPPAFEGSVRVLQEKADALQLEAELSAPGYVVITDSYDPGWKARVDGIPARVLRANVAFRAVSLPAGRHRLDLAYRPLSVLLGLALSAATALLSLVLLLRWRAVGASDEALPPGGRSNPPETGVSGGGGPIGG